MLNKPRATGAPRVSNSSGTESKAAAVITTSRCPSSRASPVGERQHSMPIRPPHPSRIIPSRSGKKPGPGEAMPPRSRSRACPTKNAPTAASTAATKTPPLRSLSARGGCTDLLFAIAGRGPTTQLARSTNRHLRFRWMRGSSAVKPAHDDTEPAISSSARDRS